MSKLIIMGGNTISGAELVLHDYLKESKEKFIILTTSCIIKSNYFNFNNVELIACDELRMIGAKKSSYKKLEKLYYMIIVLKRIKKIIEEKKIKIIITNNVGDSVYLTGLKKNNIKIFSYIHDMLEPNQLISKLVKLNKNKVDLFLTVSLSCKKSLENLGIENKKIRCIYNGMKAKDYKTKEIFSRKIIFIGSIEERKNPLEFIKFMKILKDYNYSGEIIYKYFDEKLLKQVKKEIKEEKLSIKFSFNLNRNQINEILKKTDYLFISSKKDPLPTVVLEALNSSVPVIGHNIDGIPEMVENEFNGFLYSKLSDLEEIGKKIKEMNINQYNLMAKNSNELIKSKFNNKIKIKKLDQLFKN